MTEGKDNKKNSGADRSSEDMAAGLTVEEESYAGKVIRRFLRHRLAILGAAVVLMLYMVAIFAPQLSPYDPTDTDVTRRLQLPSAEHLFGTDQVGRDVLSRVIYGSRISLTVGFVAAGISLVIGVVLGAIAGYYGGAVDNIIMRTVDLLMSIPAFLLIIAIVAVVGPNLWNVMIGIGVVRWAGYARVVRGEVLSLKEQEFVEAARAMGSSTARIVFKEILPNAVAPVIVLATLNVATAIIIETSLTFLGFGVQPPTPSWGSIISMGRQYMRRAWHIATFPGLAITVTVLAFNLLGDGLRDAFDPQMQDI